MQQPFVHPLLVRAPSAAACHHCGSWQRRGGTIIQSSSAAAAPCGGGALESKTMCSSCLLRARCCCSIIRQTCTGTGQHHAAHGVQACACECSDTCQRRGFCCQPRAAATPPPACTLCGAAAAPTTHRGMLSPALISSCSLLPTPAASRPCTDTAFSAPKSVTQNAVAPAASASSSSAA